MIHANTVVTDSDTGESRVSTVQVGVVDITAEECQTAGDKRKKTIFVQLKVLTNSRIFVLFSIVSFISHDGDVKASK